MKKNKTFCFEWFDVLDSLNNTQGTLTDERWLPVVKWVCGKRVLKSNLITRLEIQIIKRPEEYIDHKWTLVYRVYWGAIYEVCTTSFILEIDKVNKMLQELFLKFYI